MTDYNNGQIWGWNGGECPVHPETEVKAWRRGLGLPICWQAKLISWHHGYGDADIIAFQVVKVYAGPKVIWVNEYAGRIGGYYYRDEQSAKDCASYGVDRIAVKYVEARDE